MAGVVGIVAGWDLRRRVRGLVFGVVLVAIVGALILATIAGARWSSTASDRFQRASPSADLEFASDPTPSALAQLRRLPGVAGVGTLEAYGLVLPSAPDFQDIGVSDNRGFGTAVDRDRLVAGRRA